MACLCRELLPGKLYWAPESTGSPAGFKGEFVQAIDLCRHSSADSGDSIAALYSVTHYTLQAAGRAFGPLGLDVVLRFCRGLRLKLERAGEEAVAIGIAARDKNERTNVCLLVGAYLVLSYKMSAEQAASTFGPDAELGFICSWSRVDKPEPKRNLLVRDCWAALELGLTRGWLDPTCLESDESTEQFCTRWSDFVRLYDASWVVPGFVLVGADPMTTALDPNPMTFTDLYPLEEPICQTSAAPCDLDVVKHVSTQELSSPGSCSSVSTQDPGSMTGPSSRSVVSVTGRSSVDTVCKDYTAGAYPLTAESDKAFDFVTFLKNCGVTHIIRTNFDQEPGMPKEGSYNAAKFKDHGFLHADVKIVDTHGGLPKSTDVAKILRACPDEDDSSSVVFVHCKGGFGRSMVLACCLAIDRLDVPGSTLLAWARLARPGSVNTPEQELLLQSLRGRSDVRKFAGLSAQPTCGCTLQ